MKIKIIITVSLVAFILVACVPNATPVLLTETNTPIALAIPTLKPSPTATTTSTPTPKPIPANTKIAFASNEQGDWDLYVMNLDGTGFNQLTFGEQDEMNPAWSADGSKLLYQMQQGDKWQIMMMNQDGTSPIQLTNKGSNQNPSWTADGLNIMFDSDRNGNRDVFQMDLNGENQIALTNHPVNEFAPVWSPDGTLLAYISEQAQTDVDYDCTQSEFAGCPQEIFFMDTNGNLVGKTANDYIHSVVWSPDSQSIAYIANYMESSGLILYDLPAKKNKPLVEFVQALNSIYQTERSYGTFRSFSFSPKGNNGIFCMTQDDVSDPAQRIIHSGCYLIGLDGSNLYTVIRKENPINSDKDLRNYVKYSGVVMQP